MIKSWQWTSHDKEQVIKMIKSWQWKSHIFKQTSPDNEQVLTLKKSQHRSWKQTVKTHTNEKVTAMKRSEQWTLMTTLTNEQVLIMNNHSYEFVTNLPMKNFHNEHVMAINKSQNLQMNKS